MARYGICLKCCLNYINLDTQEMCDICKKTILGQRTVGDDLSLDMEFDDEELQSPFVAKIIDKNEQYEEETHDDDEDTDDDNATWRGFVDIDDDMESPDFEIDEEFDDESEDIEEDEVQEEDDFEYVSADDYDADNDDDEDDETDDDF